MTAIGRAVPTKAPRGSPRATTASGSMTATGLVNGGDWNTTTIGTASEIGISGATGGNPAETRRQLPRARVCYDSGEDHDDRADADSGRRAAHRCVTRARVFTACCVP